MITRLGSRGAIATDNTRHKYAVVPPTKIAEGISVPSVARRRTRCVSASMRRAGTAANIRAGGLRQCSVAVLRHRRAAPSGGGFAFQGLHGAARIFVTSAPFSSRAISTREFYFTLPVLPPPSPLTLLPVRVNSSLSGGYLIARAIQMEFEGANGNTRLVPGSSSMRTRTSRESVRFN